MRGEGSKSTPISLSGKSAQAIERKNDRFISSEAGGRSWAKLAQLERSHRRHTEVQLHHCIHDRDCFPVPRPPKMIFARETCFAPTACQTVAAALAKGEVPKRASINSLALRHQKLCAEYDKDRCHANVDFTFCP